MLIAPENLSRITPVGIRRVIFGLIWLCGSHASGLTQHGSQEQRRRHDRYHSAHRQQAFAGFHEVTTFSRSVYVSCAER